MADLAKLLEGILDDPETGSKLKELMGGKEDKKEQKEESSLIPDGIDPALMLKMTRAVSAFNSKKDDPRTRLLQDLKPYISRKRGRRVDEAVEVLRLITVLDIFKDDFGKD